MTTCQKRQEQNQNDFTEISSMIRNAKGSKYFVCRVINDIADFNFQS